MYNDEYHAEGDLTKLFGLKVKGDINDGAVVVFDRNHPPVRVFVESGCLYLLLRAFACFCVLLRASACFYVFLFASTCFYLLPLNSPTSKNNTKPVTRTHTKHPCTTLFDFLCWVP